MSDRRSQLTDKVIFRMNDRVTPRAVENAERTFTREELREYVEDVFIGEMPEEIDPTTEAIWRALGVVDDNRRAAGMKTFYRRED